MRPVMLLALPYLALSGCGALFHNTYKVQFDAENRSPYPLTVKASLDETSMSDDCKSSSASKTVVLAADSAEHGEAKLSCGYKPRGEVTASISRTDLDAPMGYAYTASIRLIHDQTRVTDVRVLERSSGATEPWDAVLTDGRFVIGGLPEGVGFDQAFAASYEEFYTDEVRGKHAGGYLQVFLSSKETRAIEAVGIPVDLVPEEDRYPTSPYARVQGYELDGYWYENVHAREFGRHFSFEKSGYKATIRCDAAGCSIR